MKTLFIPAISKSKLNKSLPLKELPKNIAIVYSVQYKNQAKQIKQLLEKNHDITQFAQFLGCSKPNFPEQTQAILLISDGKFHAHSLALEAKLPIYILEQNKLTQISEKEIQEFEKKQKSAYLKFLNANEVGILVSRKPGQENLKKALDFKKKLKNKKTYLFIANDINTSEFENFGLNSWINTACPRLDMDDARIVNMEKIK